MATVCSHTVCVWRDVSEGVFLFDLLSFISSVILSLQPLSDRYGEQRSQRCCFKQGWWKQATRKRLCCDLNHHMRCWRTYTRNIMNAPTARLSSGGFCTLLNIAAKQPLHVLSEETGFSGHAPNSPCFHQTAELGLGEATTPITTL